MRYFVTGGTGFIGGEVARQLREAGHEVVAIARNPDKAGNLRALGVEVHTGDITERDTLGTPMTGVDGVFHIAAWYEVGARVGRATCWKPCVTSPSRRASIPAHWPCFRIRAGKCRMKTTATTART